MNTFCLYREFTYFYTLLIEKGICDCWNVSVKLPCIYLCLSSRDIFIFPVRVSCFFSYFYIPDMYYLLQDRFPLLCPHLESRVYSEPLHSVWYHWVACWEMGQDQSSLSLVQMVRMDYVAIPAVRKNKLFRVYLNFP